MTKESLKSRRQSALLTQQQLADLAGVKLSMIADIESGRQEPSAETMDRLEKAIQYQHEALKKPQLKEVFVRARINAGLSQEQVAQRSKVVLRHYSLWEAGHFDLDDASIYRIGDAIDSIMSEKEKSNPGEPRSMTLAELAGKPASHIEKVWSELQNEASERARRVVSSRLFNEGLDELGREAEALEAENAALKAENEKLKRLSPKRGRRGKVR